MHHTIDPEISHPPLLANGDDFYKRALVEEGNLARTFHALAKSRRGETITIGVIGGSITSGACASREEFRYGNRIAEWWRQTFPRTEVRLVNAGIGATGTSYGVLRARHDLLAHRPDFVVVEFACNDRNVRSSAETMEGLVRQILSSSRLPAVVEMFLMRSNPEVDGVTAQEWHFKVAQYYQLPMLSYRDALTAEIEAGRTKWSDFSPDSVHPNDRGHAEIARLVTRRLETCLAQLQPDDQLPEVAGLPAPFLTGLFDQVKLIQAEALQPIVNRGWQKHSGANFITDSMRDSTYWISNEPGSIVEFEISGQLINLMFFRINGPMGQVAVRIDDGEPVILDAWYAPTWGGYRDTVVIGQNLAPGPHRVQVKLLTEKNDQSAGHEFRILGLGSAGPNVDSPIS